MRFFTNNSFIQIHHQRSKSVITPLTFFNNKALTFLTVKKIRSTNDLTNVVLMYLAWDIFSTDSLVLTF